MINQTVTIASYDKSKNYFTAKTSLGENILFDPFVTCAIELSDDAYLDGKAFEFVGKTYICFSYSVQVWNDGMAMLTPDENGMAEIKG